MKKIIGILLILVGPILGAGLFAIGASQDAPGMCVIGFGLALIFVVKGLVLADRISSYWSNRLLFTAFGAGGVLLTTVLLADGEFESRPQLSLIGFVIGIGLLYLGNRRQVREK